MTFDPASLLCLVYWTPPMLFCGESVSPLYKQANGNTHVYPAHSKDHRVVGAGGLQKARKL